MGRIQLNVWGIIEFGDEFVNYGSFPPALAEMLKTYNVSGGVGTY